ncbi:D-alanyl-D-alanine carboxypeptidase / D-alanyl-D-alanine-endopeptidase (penicillin-binding protein 4) [Arthrobacter alpinus]|uniref:D-alanyl-D-alanine carboxypeptidase / D-alanyl-D-alanine-endopeptidase (Penicillin-binding protein 4) n=1 Tax=Arthrobacter alpinus TaxID=656366 RepID=A0A1H5N538_9MICC|nr:D-alanyl-D-alanine carboxypeptidase [Arthrobacter alpinus]SEE95778.1 D-alanyl-D-alanine carboxypeptidase / D-alanyl-D-alanine-endopeptidase (penicillin-binding protein 4) [Arthrobacter alpinus]
MGRTSKVVTSGLLICSLAAVSVPAGMQLVPAFLPQDPAAVAVLPAAQEMPTTLGEISGVAPLLSTAPLPNAATLATDLKKALTYDAEGTFGMYVADAVTGQELFSQAGETAKTPASNLKLLAAGAVLRTLGPDARFSTDVVSGATAHEIVLRAGGDAMLASGESEPGSVMGHAGLATLAQQSAAALAAAGVTGPVTLTIDDTLFTGAALNPKWTDGDVDAGEIAPIFPMAMYAGRVAPEVLTGARPQDSSVAVAEAFANALEVAGVATTGAITRGSSPAADADTTPGQAKPGSVLASISSATVAEQAQYMLAESDNYVAEVLGRMAALKLGLPASNDGAVAAVRQVVTELGLPMDDVVTTDICGLATGNLISPRKFVKLLSLMLADPAADIGQALPGLPIAGLTGSLDNRFVSSTQIDGAGVVRAKTGSLNLVTSLSGYVINSEGRLLVFSILGNGLTDGAAAARPVVDAAAAVLARS